MTTTGDLTLRNLIITGGIGNFGGGIHTFGNLRIINSTIVGNRADIGGGVYSNTNGDSTARVTTIINSTISGNEATFGGGIENRGGLTRIFNSTITDNRAAGGGGVLTLDTFSGRTEIKGSIIVGNTLLDGETANDVSAFATTNRFNSLGYNLVGAAGANVDFAQEFNALGDQTNVTPFEVKLGPLADNGGPTQTHALQTGSVAIDALPRSACDQAADQRGVARPQGAACDIGAYEYTAVSLSINANGTVNSRTGAATVGGSLTCSGPLQVNVQVRLEQEQKARRVSTVVQASGTTTVVCTGSSPATWSITLQPSSGAFHNNTATASAEALNSDAASATSRGVRLRWAR